LAATRRPAIVREAKSLPVEVENSLQRLSIDPEHRSQNRGLSEEDEMNALGWVESLLR
jgi:hypothetical protein